jgi:hypothetical protein
MRSRGDDRRADAVGSAAGTMVADIEHTAISAGVIHRRRESIRTILTPWVWTID